MPENEELSETQQALRERMNKLMEEHTTLLSSLSDLADDEAEDRVGSLEQAYRDITSTDELDIPEPEEVNDAGTSLPGVAVVDEPSRQLQLPDPEPIPLEVDEGESVSVGLPDPRPISTDLDPSNTGDLGAISDASTTTGPQTPDLNKSRYTPPEELTEGIPQTEEIPVPGRPEYVPQDADFEPLPQRMDLSDAYVSEFPDDAEPSPPPDVEDLASTLRQYMDLMNQALRTLQGVVQEGVVELEAINNRNNRLR